MYARVTRFKVDPRDIDLDIAQDVFERHVVPEMRKQMGYEGCYLLRTERGEGLIVSLWEDEQAALASEHNGYYAEQMQELLPLLGDRPAPSHENYEVSFADHPVEED